MFEGSSEALALSVELRSSLACLVEEVGCALSVVPVTPLTEFLPVVPGSVLGAVVPVEAGSSVPAQKSLLSGRELHWERMTSTLSRNIDRVYLAAAAGTMRLTVDKLCGCQRETT